MNSKNDRWGPQLHNVRTLRPQKGIKRSFYKRDNKIKQLIEKIKQQRIDRKKGAQVRDVRYTKASTGETVHADYDILPVVEQNGLYEIQEYIMTDVDFQKLQYAKECIANEYERNDFIDTQEIQRKSPVRVMYATIDYEVIQQLRMNRDFDEYEDARENFIMLVEHQRVKKRILESKDKEANYIYERGKTKQPREYGYIGGIEHTFKGNRRVYDLRDKRAKSINKAVLNSLFTGAIDRRKYEDGDQR